MDFHKCQFCEHNNPADSKYCAECGGCLYLLPCPSCGAVNDVMAVTCYQCSARLRDGGEASFDTPAPVAVVSRPGNVNILSRAADLGALDTVIPQAPVSASTGLLSPQRAKLIAGAAVLSVVAVLGYFGYRQHFPARATEPTAAGGDPRGLGGPASAGVIRADAAAVGTSPAARPAAAAGQAPSAANERQSGLASVESKGAAVGGDPGNPATKGGSVSVAGATPVTACTESAATLGLCGAARDQNKAANLRPGITDAGKAAPQEPPVQSSCVDAAAALGLCTPSSAVPAVTHTQRKE